MLARLLDLNQKRAKLERLAGTGTGTGRGKGKRAGKRGGAAKKSVPPAAGDLFEPGE